MCFNIRVAGLQSGKMVLPRQDGQRGPHPWTRQCYPPSFPNAERIIKQTTTEAGHLPYDYRRLYFPQHVVAVHRITVSRSICPTKFTNPKSLSPMTNGSSPTPWP